MALKEAIEYIKKNLIVKVETLGKEGLINAAKTSLSSKLIGPEGNIFGNMVVDAMLNIKNEEGKYPVKNVHIVKCHGQSLHQSKLINGYILEGARAAQGMPMQVKGVKIACVDFNLHKGKMQMGVSILIEDPAELEKVRLKELDITKQRCLRILESGANVILATKGIDDFALKYFVEKGCIAIRRVTKNDLRRIAEASGATIALSMSDLEGEEKFDPAWLGTADLCKEERVGDFDYVFIEGFKHTKTQTILVRGANEYMIAEIERSIHDALCVVKRVLESNTVVAGGGAVEIALNVYLDNYARGLGSREQLAIAEFADALLVIPKTLAVNATQDATDLVAKLRAFHFAAQSGDEKKKDYCYAGLDLINGKIRNSIKAGVLEPSISKIKSLK
jgi:T-complex protein 1 subunit alpha